jgi:hypothetical protein
MSTTPTPTFGTQVLGQTEKALNAILDRHLAGTGVSEPQWIVLTLTVTGGGSVERAQLLARVTGALKIGEDEAESLIAGLAENGLLDAPVGAPTVTATDDGRQLHARIRTAVSEITARMWGDLPAEDLETTGRVLSTILDRANAELARQ